MPSKHLIAIVLLVGICSGAAAIYVWQGRQMAQTGENAQPENVFSINELLGNPENFENKTVRIGGMITGIRTYLENIEDDTGVIPSSHISSFEGSLYNYGGEENVAISALIKYAWAMDPPHTFVLYIENVEKAGTEQPGLVKINQILENWWTFYDNEVTIIGTYKIASTFYTISDNTGNITCYGSGSFPYNVWENVVIEGKGVLIPSPSSIQPSYILWIEIQKIEG